VGIDHWEWELTAAVLSVCALAAIVGVLVAFDQRPVPDLPSGLTVTDICPEHIHSAFLSNFGFLCQINAIISFLSTLAKSSLTLTLAAALRQERWLWFIDRPRPLGNIDDFEEASRGPYGSLILLFKLRGR